MYRATLFVVATVALGLCIPAKAKAVAPSILVNGIQQFVNGSEDYVFTTGTDLLKVTFDVYSNDPNPYQISIRSTVSWSNGGGGSGTAVTVYTNYDEPTEIFTDLSVVDSNTTSQDVDATIRIEYKLSSNGAWIDSGVEEVVHFYYFE